MGKTTLHFSTNIGKHTWFFSGAPEFCKQVQERMSGYRFNNGYNGKVHLTTFGLQFDDPNDVSVVVSYTPDYLSDYEATDKDVQEALEELIAKIKEEINILLKEYFLTNKLPQGEVVYTNYQFWVPFDKEQSNEGAYIFQISELKYSMDTYVQELNTDE